MKSYLKKHWFQYHVNVRDKFDKIPDLLFPRCGMSGDLSEFLSSFSFSIMSTRPQKAFYRQFVIWKKICIKKPIIRIAGFLKSKTNFWTTVVSIFFMNNKTRFSYCRWRNCRGKGFCKFQKFCPCLRNFNSSLIQNNVSK